MTEDEVREVAAGARSESEAPAADGPNYAEMMSAYADLGDMLAEGPTGNEHARDIHHAAVRAFSLSDRYHYEAEQLLELHRTRVDEEAA